MRIFPFKPIQFVPFGTKFRFVAHIRLAIIETAILAVLTVALLSTLGLNFGVDFRGGTIIEVRNKSGAADVPALRSKLGELKLGEVQIQQFGPPSDVLIRIGAKKNEDEKQTAQNVQRVKDAVGDGVEYRRVETVGATVSQELIRSAIVSLIVATVGIFAFLWVRFEWQFSVAAVIALLHDVATVLCFLSITQLEFDLTVVAALLTFIGYAVNDTVVTFDRIRENLRKFKKMPIGDLIDLSVNETLSRTAMTAGATILALTALYVFGGDVISGFTTTMLFGAVVSSYTSMFIAAPFLALIGVKRDWSGVDKAAEGKRKASPAQAEMEDAFSVAGPPPAAQAATLAGKASLVDAKLAAAEAIPVRQPATAKAATESNPQARRTSAPPKGRGKTRSKKRG